MNFIEPTAIVMHPQDFTSVRLAKASTSGDYLAAPIIESSPNRLWGLPLIQSVVIEKGTALVGSFEVGCKLFDREQARITFTESGLSDTPGQELFTRNLIRFRAEERLAFGVVRPEAFAIRTEL
jgi:HK97 family phage major capsid protein